MTKIQGGQKLKLLPDSSISRDYRYRLSAFEMLQSLLFLLFVQMLLLREMNQQLAQNVHNHFLK